MKEALLTLAGLLLIISLGRPAPLTLEIRLRNRIAAIDLYQMAAVIEAESRGEPERCKCLAGQVLKNRAARQGRTIAKSSFVGVKQKAPSEASIEVARRVLKEEHEHGFLYFLNPDLATDKDWIMKNRNKKKTRCGKHLFW